MSISDIPAPIGGIPAYMTNGTLTIIYLPRELLRCYPGRRSIERGLGAMVTYYDLFTFVVMLCSVITLVIMILNNRK